ncbi:MAG: ATP-binding protein [Acidobacteriota bacterium]
MTRFRLPKVERLTARLAGGMIAFIMIPVAAGTYLLSSVHYDHAVEARREAAELEVNILESALRHQMLRRDTELMTDILQEVGRKPNVQRAMVIDHIGVVRLSSRRSDLGTTLSRESPTCLVCHAQDARSRLRWVLLNDDGADVLRSVLPVENRPECHQCHDPSAKLNGIVVLDVSLAPVQAQFQRDLVWLGGATIVVTLLMLGGVGVHVRRLVLSRLTRLGGTARSIARGALDERADAGGDDVIAELAADFNAMADATTRLITDVKERERQISGVINSLDDGLIVLDRDLRVVAANSCIAKWLGSYPESLRGQSCRRAVGHALPCRDDPDCPTARCLSTGLFQRATFRLPRSAGGEERIYEVYASPVYGDNGSVGQVVEAWRDITDRVREEEHLAEIERLSSLGILASGLSHEVNTPLATTLTCSEAIIDQLSDVVRARADPDTLSAIREGATVIRDQVLRCRTITEQFLRFARGIPPSTEPIDLRRVVGGVIALAEPTAREAGVDVVLQGEDPVPIVTANTEVVQHVVLNVLVNAIESCAGAGGKVAMEFLVDSGVRLRIRDNGCGISPEIQRHLFEPFRTQKARGTGLGLFLSRTFMRRFNGDVTLVESAIGRGSCLEVVFPLALAGSP